MVFIERTDFKEVSRGCEGSCLLLSPVLRSLHLLLSVHLFLLQMNQPLPDIGVGGEASCPFLTCAVSCVHTTSYL